MFVAPVPAIFSGLGDWVTDIVERLGYAGIAGLIALENIVPPIPSEIILPLAGYMAENGEFWVPGVVLAATIGSLIGALVLYALGALLGDLRLNRLVKRFGRYIGVRTQDLEKANRWLDRYGTIAVLICRLVPVVRSFVSIPAGIRRMPLGRFLILTAIGSAIWNSVLVGFGWFLGDNWEEVGNVVSILSYVVVAVAAIAIIAFVGRRLILARQ
jgi:membrane protein DedA with SNARE-associated domain